MQQIEEPNDNEEILLKSGINPNTFNLLFKDKEDLTKDEKLTSEQVCTLTEIEYYTHNKLTRLKYKLLKLIKKILNHNGYYDIEFAKKYNSYFYKLPNKKIEFDILSRYSYDKKLRQLLESSERYGKCHSFSLIIAKSFPDSKIITGYLSSKQNEHVLHTVVEVKTIHGKSLYIDFTKNLIMSKKAYISLTNFQILNEFPISSYNEELIDLVPLLLKPCMVFHDELQRDLAKLKKNLQTKEEK